MSLCSAQRHTEMDSTGEGSSDALRTSTSTIDSSLLSSGLRASSSPGAISTSCTFIATPETVYSTQDGGWSPGSVVLSHANSSSVGAALQDLNLDSDEGSTRDASIGIALIPLELLEKVVLNMDDPRDFVRLSTVCRKLSAFVQASERKFAMKFARRQTTLTRMVLENLYFDWYEPRKTPRYSKLGFAWIQDGITRAKNVTQLVTSFESMGLLRLYRLLPRATPHSQAMLQTLRRQLETLFLGAEICSIKLGRNALDKLLSPSQRTVFRATLKNTVAVCAFWMVGLRLEPFDLSDNSIRIEPASENGRILGDLVNGSLSFGAKFMNDVLKHNVRGDTEMMRGLLDYMAEDLFTVPRLAISRHMKRIQFKTHLINRVGTRAIVRGLLNMTDWKEHFVNEQMWQDAMEEIGWSVPMKYRTLFGRRQYESNGADGPEWSIALPLWYAMVP